jgi:hypothetical protein
MGHISSIGAGMFTDMAVSTSSAPATYDEAGFEALFQTEDTDFYRIKNIREFPAIGTPPNIVNVPVYGQSTSQQIQGQADAPNMELQLNFVASDWAAGSNLGDLVGDGTQYVFRFAILNELPPNFANSTTTGIGGTTAAPVENSCYYFVGKIEALQVSPQLTDANTATVTISVQSDIYGAYTITAV